MRPVKVRGVGFASHCPPGPLKDYEELKKGVFKRARKIVREDIEEWEEDMTMCMA